MPEGEPINRAEQAKDTQKELQEIAKQGGWQPTPIEELPKADGTGGLPEGTPLATDRKPDGEPATYRDEPSSLTPGQRERLYSLPKSPVKGRKGNYYANGVMRAEFGNHNSDSLRESPQAFTKLTHNTELPKEKSRKLAAAARATRFSSRDEEAEREQTQQWARLSEQKALGIPFSPDSEPDHSLYGRRETQRTGLIKNIPQTYGGSTNPTAISVEGGLKQEIQTARLTAEELYDTDPERFSQMSDEEFVAVWRRAQESAQYQAEMQAYHEILESYDRRIAEFQQRLLSLEALLKEGMSYYALAEVLRVESTYGDDRRLDPSQSLEEVIRNRIQTVQLGLDRMRADKDRILTEQMPKL